MQNIIVGYSGHAYVAIDAFAASGNVFDGYCENEEKAANPFQLLYKGKETTFLENNPVAKFFIGIGSNHIRAAIFKKIYSFDKEIINVIHPSAVISLSVLIGKGVLVAANATVNPLAVIGNGVICNTGSIIEHECKVGDFSHIAPGAVLAGNVTVGSGSFVGANSVVKQGVRIGDNVMIGSGTVIIKDIPNNTTVVGNPQRFI